MDNKLVSKSIDNCEKKKRNLWLDLLRIFAIFMVLCVHISPLLDNAPSIVSKVFSLGAYGVALYFVISGYFSYCSTVSSSYKDYFKKKCIRILPMYYISLLFTFIIEVFITKNAPLDLKWLLHILFLGMFYPTAEFGWWNSVNFFWTMPLFMAWYILCPLIFKIFNNTNKLGVLTVASACVVPFIKKGMLLIASEQFVNWNFFSLLYCFLIGSLAYFSIKDNKRSAGFIWGVVIFGAGYVVGNRSGFLIFSVFFYYVILITSFIDISNTNDKISRLIISLSNSTYSVYLFHWFILTALKYVGVNINWCVKYVIFVVLSFALGIVLFYFAEKPIGALLKKSTVKKE